MSNVRLFYSPGTALRIDSGTGVHVGQEKPFDKEKPRLRDITVRRAFRGIEMNTVDGVIGTVDIESVRDYGIKLNAGAVQFEGPVHIYGVGNNGSDYVSLGNANPTTHPGACLWVDSSAGGSWGGPFYVETARMGMKLDGSANNFGPIYSLNCYHSHIEINGQRNTLHDVQIDMHSAITNPAILVGNQAQDTTIERCQFRASEVAGRPVPSGKTCISITNGSRLRLRGINIYGADGSPAALVTTSATLDYCEIEINCLYGGNVVLDLFTSVDRIGNGNRISVNRYPWTGAIINLGPLWLPANDAALSEDDKEQENNEVYINGVRYYRVGPN